MLGRFVRYIEQGLECDIVELKGYSPPLRDEKLLEQIVKEILAVANTGRQGFILFGVNDADNRHRGKEPVPGVEQIYSDDEIERRLNDKFMQFTEPPVKVSYRSYEYKDKKVGVLTVLRSDRRPHMVARNGAHELTRGKYYLRQGTVTGVMAPDDLRQISLERQSDKKYMTLLNFTHPFTETQISQLEQTLDCFIEHVWPDCKIELDISASFEEQIRHLVDNLGYEAYEWQDVSRWLVSLPGLSEASAVLLAEMHGRMGQFPTIVRRRPSDKKGVSDYAVEEIINLSEVRGRARRTGALDMNM